MHSFETIFSTSHFLVTHSEHLVCISSAYMFRVLYQQHETICEESDKIILSWLKS